MLELPHGAAETAPIAWRTAHGYDRMARQERRQVFRHGNRPHPRTAAAMRNRKCLVQVQVAHVRADCRRACQPDLRVHVRAVHVDLAAVLVHGRADLANPILEHAVRARIRHHEAREILVVLLGLGAQIVDVNIAAVVARHDHDGHAGQARTRRVGAVRRLRNQNDVAFEIAASAMIGANDQQACVLSLCA